MADDPRSRFEVSRTKQVEIKKAANLAFGLMTAVGIALVLFVTADSWALAIAAVGVAGLAGIYLVTHSPTTPTPPE